MQKAERLTKLPPYLYVQIRRKVREAQERGVDVISLGVGEPDPGYPAYLASAIFAGATVERVPLRAENGFLLDFDDVPADLAKRTKIIWLSYPNNPTTAVAPLDFWQRAVDFCRHHDIVLAS